MGFSITAQQKQSSLRGVYEKKFARPDIFCRRDRAAKYSSGLAAEVRRSPDWDKTLEAAKKEGKIVLAIPPANELRREMETVLKAKFGLEAELVSAPGPRNASRIASERKAGVS